MTPRRWPSAASSWPATRSACIKAARLHEETGVDQLQFLMATETVPHKKVMESIEMFGKHVIPAFRQSEQSAP